RLVDGYSHPWLIFGRGMVNAYAVTMNADLMQTGAAVDVATHIDLASMPSATRRSFHLIESARAYSLAGENVAVVHLLKKAHGASPETARFNLFARSTVTELAQGGASPLVRDEVSYLARELGIPA
ncbi:MAG: hypothetical protein WAO15_11700, partial [Mycobacterium sp.]